jgi:hypothetical protein
MVSDDFLTIMADPPYLDEPSLGRFLRERLDPAIIENKGIPGLSHRFRPDYRSESHRLIVEYDGNQHYQRAVHVLRDHVRDVVLTEAGYTVVRIPYFVQLVPETIRYLFGDRVADQTAFKTFPQGFIADTVVFPADYCELGIERFQHDLQRFAFIAADILASLARATERLGDWRLVYPPSMHQALIAALPPA